MVLILSVAQSRNPRKFTKSSTRASFFFRAQNTRVTYRRGDYGVNNAMTQVTATIEIYC